MTISSLYKCTGRAIALPSRVDVGGSGISEIFKFYIKVFYVMGKVLSGELSCMGTGLVFTCCGTNVECSYIHFLFMKENPTFMPQQVNIDT